MNPDEQRSMARWAASVALHSGSILPDEFDTSSYFSDSARRRFYTEVLNRDVSDLADSYSNFTLDRRIRADELANIGDAAQLTRVIELHLTENQLLDPTKMSEFLPFDMLPDDTWSAL